MRYYGAAQSIRAVLEDCKLDSKHLLRKGSMVMMVAAFQHFDPSAWGSDVNHFKYKLFIKANTDAIGSGPGAKAKSRGLSGVWWRTTSVHGSALRYE